MGLCGNLSLLEKGLPINIGADNMSKELYFETTKSEVVYVGPLWTDLPGSWQTKPSLLTRPGLVSRAKQSIWQYRNIPINMEYCKEYLHLSSIKWNHFNGCLFGPCGSKWWIFTIWRVLQIILLYIIREKQGRNTAFQTGPEILIAQLLNHRGKLNG